MTEEVTQTMKALILAAGLGSRLKHLTTDKPKALVSVAGKPILQYQLEALVSCGVQEVCIVIGHHGARLQDFVKEKFSRLTVSYVWNHEFAASNSSYSFWLAKDFVLGTSYIHVNCDIVFRASLLRELVASPHSNVIAIRKDIELTNSMENVVLDGERIVKMILKRIPESMAKAYGLAKFSPESTLLILRKLQPHLDKGDKNQNCYGMIREGTAEVPYYSLDARGLPLMEINTLDDLQGAERFSSD